VPARRSLPRRVAMTLIDLGATGGRRQCGRGNPAVHPQAAAGDIRTSRGPASTATHICFPSCTTPSFSRKGPGARGERQITSRQTADSLAGASALWGRFGTGWKTCPTARRARRLPRRRFVPPPAGNAPRQGSCGSGCCRTPRTTPGSASRPIRHTPAPRAASCR
jgi:hypothetical protein